MRQKQKEKRSFSFLAMPSAVITYPKLQQMSGKSKKIEEAHHLDEPPLRFFRI